MKSKLNTKGRVEQIGMIGVDAGLCWIGDPCYILHKDKAAKYEHDRPAKAIGESWSGFCELLGDERTHTQFNYDLGHPGLGVCVSTGYGDGEYPVYAEFGAEGRVTKVWVGFFADEEE